MRLLYLLFFPGVILHEFSHYLACALTGVKVFDVKFFGTKEAYVKHEKPGILQSILITIAPFFVSNFVGYLLLSEAHLLLASYFLASVVFYWIGISAVYFSFPSDADAKNSFHAFIAFSKQKLFSGSPITRFLWLPVIPLVFLPVALVLSSIIFFNYIFFLRLLWLFFVFSVSL